MKIILFFNSRNCSLPYLLMIISFTDASSMLNPAKLLLVINSGAGPLWLRFSAVVIGVLGELVSWGLVLSESSATGIQPWSGLWSFLLSWNWMWETFFMSSKTSLFSVCLCSSVFTSPHSSSLLCLPVPPKSFFQHQVEGVSKAILIFIPVDCTGRRTVKDFFFQRCNLPFLFMVCHYLLQPFIPSLSWSFSHSMDLML